MIQLHDLSRFNSLVSFRLDVKGVKDLEEKALKFIKNKKRYHLIILDTKTDTILKNYERGF